MAIEQGLPANDSSSGFTLLPGNEGTKMASEDDKTLPKDAESETVESQDNEQTRKQVFESKESSACKVQGANEIHLEEQKLKEVVNKESDGVKSKADQAAIVESLPADKTLPRVEINEVKTEDEIDRGEVKSEENSTIAVNGDTNSLGPESHETENENESNDSDEKKTTTPKEELLIEETPPHTSSNDVESVKDENESNDSDEMKSTTPGGDLSSEGTSTETCPNDVKNVKGGNESNGSGDVELTVPNDVSSEGTSTDTTPYNVKSVKDDSESNDSDKMMSTET